MIRKSLKFLFAATPSKNIDVFKLRSVKKTKNLFCVVVCKNSQFFKRWKFVKCELLNYGRQQRPVQ